MANHVLIRSYPLAVSAILDDYRNIRFIAPELDNIDQIFHLCLRISQESYVYMSDSLLVSPKVLCHIIHYKPHIFSSINRIVLDSITTNQWIKVLATTGYQHIDPKADNPFVAHLTDDLDFATKLIRISSLFLKYFCSEIRANYKIATMAIEQNPAALEYCSEELKGNRGIIDFAIRQQLYLRPKNLHPFKFAAQALKDDDCLIRIALKTIGGARALQYLGKDILATESFWRTAHSTSFNIIWSESTDHKESLEFSFPRNTNSDSLASGLEWAPDTIRDDREIVLLALKECSDTYRYISKRLKNDIDLATIAVSKNPNLLSVVPDIIFKSPKFSLKYPTYGKIEPSLWRNPEVIVNYRSLCKEITSDKISVAPLDILPDDFSENIWYVQQCIYWHGWGQLDFTQFTFADIALPQLIEKQKPDWISILSKFHEPKSKGQLKRILPIFGVVDSEIIHAIPHKFWDCRPLVQILIEYVRLSHHVSTECKLLILSMLKINSTGMIDDNLGYSPRDLEALGYASAFSSKYLINYIQTGGSFSHLPIEHKSNLSLWKIRDSSRSGTHYLLDYLALSADNNIDCAISMKMIKSNPELWFGLRSSHFDSIGATIAGMSCLWDFGDLSELLPRRFSELPESTRADPNVARLAFSINSKCASNLSSAFYADTDKIIEIAAKVDQHLYTRWGCCEFFDHIPKEYTSDVAFFRQFSATIDPCPMTNSDSRVLMVNYNIRAFDDCILLDDALMLDLLPSCPHLFLFCSDAIQENSAIALMVTIKWPDVYHSLRTSIREDAYFAHNCVLACPYLMSSLPNSLQKNEQFLETVYTALKTRYDMNEYSYIQDCLGRMIPDATWFHD